LHLMTAGHADTPEIRERENRLRSLMMQCWMKSGRRRAWEALTSAGLKDLTMCMRKNFLYRRNMRISDLSLNLRESTAMQKCISTGKEQDFVRMDIQIFT